MDGPTSGSLGPALDLETVPEDSGGARSTARFVYTPEQNPGHADAFTFRVSDGIDQSEPAQVEIAFENTAPVANDRAVSVPRGSRHSS